MVVLCVFIATIFGFKLDVVLSMVCLEQKREACCSATAIEFNEWLYCYSELALAFPIATATRPCPPQLERKGLRAVHAFHARKKTETKGA